ncbi:MAG: hypothetical protein SVV80_10370 [Planctomycetota bacterium]|nr:hypothetical protein [Planctomycetota bacterium]
MGHQELNDMCVIYESRQDNCWIAHSLRTDQIGTGDCVVNALADLLKAIEQIFDLANQEKDISVLREAPTRIQQMAKTADPLPREIYEIAYKRVHGEWPKDIKARFEIPHRRKYKTNIPEAAVA